MLDGCSVREARARVQGMMTASGIWLATAAAAFLTASFPAADLLMIAGVGTLAVMSGRDWAPALPLAAALAVEPAFTPWALAAAAITWRTASRFAPPALDSEPQRQLMRARRRDETASVLVVQAQAPDGPALGSLWAGLRATDGFELARDADWIELRAVLVDEGLERAACEERLSGVFGRDRGVRIGWASFPADGVTLDVLVEAARADLRSRVDVQRPAAPTEPGAAARTVAPAAAAAAAEGG